MELIKKTSMYFLNHVFFYISIIYMKWFFLIVFIHYVVEFYSIFVNVFPPLEQTFTFAKRSAILFTLPGSTRANILDYTLYRL